jgi:4-amino-4-deoxy-L-arabinose transferase-like glycosyltransferase
VVAMLYYVFGRNQLLVQLFNATLGCLTIVLLYAMAKDLFDVAVARWAARFMAFFPQMVFWSGGMYKDTAIMFCIAACMYSVLQLRRAFRLRQLLLFVGAGLALMTFRFYVFYFVAFATVGTFLFSQRRGLIGGVFGQLTLLGVFLAAFSVASSSEMLDRHTSYFDLERVQIAREDQARWGASGFAAESDVSTVEGALTALPVGLVYLLFAPFPWAISGIRQALTVPETLVWYALMPSFVRGLRHTIRHRLRDALPILVFAAALTGAYALFQGNVGTAYRQRTQVTMFYFMFMAVGLTQRRRAAAPGVLPAAQPAR